VRRTSCPVCGSVAHRCVSRPVRETVRSTTGVGAGTVFAPASSAADDADEDDPDVPTADGWSEEDVPLLPLPLLLPPPAPPAVAAAGTADMSQQSLLRSTWLKACLCILAVADGGALIRPTTVPLMGVLAAAAAASAIVPAAALAAAGGTSEPRGFSAGSGDPCPSLPLVAATDGLGEDISASFARDPAEAGAGAAVPLVVSVIALPKKASLKPTFSCVHSHSLTSRRDASGVEKDTKNGMGQLKNRQPPTLEVPQAAWRQGMPSLRPVRVPMAAK
jgi:hypothetical protein